MLSEEPGTSKKFRGIRPGFGISSKGRSGRARYGVEPAGRGRPARPGATGSRPMTSTLEEFLRRYDIPSDILAQSGDRILIIHPCSGRGAGSLHLFSERADLAP